MKSMIASCFYLWIKRKHYFKPELNPGFLVNYHYGEKEGEGTRHGQE